MKKNQVMPTLWMHCRDASIKIWKNTAIMLPLQATLDDMLRNEKEGKISCFLTAEDGNGINGTLAGLEKMYKMGIRLISITWNHENCLGYPNSFDPEKMALPLKPFGCEMIDAMNRMGIIADVSHLSDGGFWDVVRICKENHKPFVASHSDCRALTPHSRNLTDEMIRAIAECGGAIGVNFSAGFISPDIHSHTSRIDDMVRHMKHMYQVGGIECMALGGDWTGSAAIWRSTRWTRFRCSSTVCTRKALPPASWTS